MPAAVAITRDDYTAAELSQIAARTHEGDAARRMLALAHVMDGRSRGEVAALCGMDRQILRDWVHRYNGEGLAGTALGRDRTPHHAGQSCRRGTRSRRMASARRPTKRSARQAH